MKAGQRIVNMYAESAIQLLLPQLEAGLFDDNWRIRYSSVQLLGDLLYKISGVSGKMTTETANDDDNFGTEKSQKVCLIQLFAACSFQCSPFIVCYFFNHSADDGLRVRIILLTVSNVINAC